MPSFDDDGEGLHGFGKCIACGGVAELPSVRNMADEVMPPENTVGQQIRIRRRQLAISQDAVALALNVSRGLVSQWEQGRTRVPSDTLAKLADVLGVTRSYLVGDAPLPPIKTPISQLSSQSISAISLAREAGEYHEVSPEEELLAKRYQYEEQILLALFRSMSHEERQKFMRVAHALKD